MKNFRYVFYPIYLITILAVIAISIDINQSLIWLREWGWVKYFSDLPYYGRNLLLFLSGLMIVEFIMHNWYLSKLKKSSK